MPLSNDELLRKAATYGAGVAARPVVKQIEVREPEVIHVRSGSGDGAAVGAAEDRWRSHSTLYIPKPPRFPTLLAEPFDPVIDLPEVERFIASEYYTQHWVTTGTVVDTSDVLHPTITVYGYERVYVFRVWMRLEDYDKRFPPTKDGDEDDDDEDDDEDDDDDDDKEGCPNEREGL